MSKLDQLIKSIDRLVELHVEILHVLENAGVPEHTSSHTSQKPKLDKDLLEKLMNTDEVTEALGFSKRTLSRNIKSEIFTPIRIGRQNWFDPSQVDALKNFYLK